MRYSHIDEYDFDNGPGVRVVLWTQGCPHRCLGCHNPHTWKEDAGKKFSEEERDFIWEKLNEYVEKDFSVLGGEPLAPYNREGVLELLKWLKQKRPGLDVWVWTGYLYEDIESLEVMEYIDVLVDGPFSLSEIDLSFRWKGSSNQRVIDMKSTRLNKSIVLHEENERRK